MNTTEPTRDKHEQPPRRHRLKRIIGIAALVAFIIAAPTISNLLDFGVRVGEGAAVESSVAGFYASPTVSPAAAAPGTIVRSEPVVGAPDGAQAVRVVYHSTDVDGADILVSGLIVAPIEPAASGSRTVVSWAHPTTGTAPRCAPSSGIAPFDLIEGLTDLLADGNVVVATDYAGMGLPGPASFLIGATEAANVLDIARAAQHVDGIGASNRVVLWGHSQGGHAALFAAQRAAVRPGAPPPWSSSRGSRERSRRPPRCGHRRRLRGHDRRLRLQRLRDGLRRPASG
ncbi:lipase family protein [Plantibacter flavus]|uniref:alpha/beta fold hydrolase n=1 Tax=Plantibacter flavus TaxID=150123 RepID=UPI003F18C837